MADQNTITPDEQIDGTEIVDEAVGDDAYHEPSYKTRDDDGGARILTTKVPALGHVDVRQPGYGHMKTLTEAFQGYDGETMPDPVHLAYMFYHLIERPDLAADMDGPDDTAFIDAYLTFDEVLGYFAAVVAALPDTMAADADVDVDAEVVEDAPEAEAEGN